MAAPGAGAAWPGKITIRYLDATGRRIAISKRAGTFWVLDHATTSEGPGVIEISASPTSAPATGPFAGTNLEIKFAYPQPSPYSACLAGGWSGVSTPSFMYWQEF